MESSKSIDTKKCTYSPVKIVEKVICSSIKTIINQLRVWKLESYITKNKRELWLSAMRCMELLWKWTRGLLWIVDFVLV